MMITYYIRGLVLEKDIECHILLLGYLCVDKGIVIGRGRHGIATQEFIPLPKTGLGLFEIMVLPNIKNYHIFYAANLKNQPSF